MDNEKEFMKVASNMTTSAKIRSKNADDNLNFSKQTDDSAEASQARNLAGEYLCFGGELLEKSNIVYDDFSRSPIFNQSSEQDVTVEGKTFTAYPVGSPEWHGAISALDGGNASKIISDPKAILKYIIPQSSGDPRSTLTNDPRFASSFQTLDLATEKPTGHSLYAYYQLLGPIAKTLVNSEYYSYTNDEEKYAIFALLTDDSILGINSDNITTMPSELMNYLDSNKDASVKLRYSSTSARDVDEKDLKFIIEYFNSLLAVGNYRFPNYEKYANIDFDRYNCDDLNIDEFSKLDRMQQYYLKNNFSNDELNELYKSMSDSKDADIFLNMSIYLKNYVNEKLKIDLNFDEKVFDRVKAYCSIVKAFRPFNNDTKRLCDNEQFSTNDKKQYYIVQLNKLQEEKRKKEIRKIKLLTKLQQAGISDIRITESSLDSFKQSIAESDSKEEIVDNIINKHKLVGFDDVYSYKMGEDRVIVKEKAGKKYVLSYPHHHDLFSDEES
ncbi:MAG: hypothetical protein IJI43_00920 [Bacilli bacterium]|nr:hypothetical protein [Bacilli bacterium]